MNFDSPARYQIRIQGWLESHWSDRLEGMSISHPATGDEQLATTLEGELLDQASLAGVLNTLYELHLPVLSVKYLATQTTSDQES